MKLSDLPEEQRVQARQRTGATVLAVLQDGLLHSRDAVVELAVEASGVQRESVMNMIAALTNYGMVARANLSTGVYLHLDRDWIDAMQALGPLPRVGSAESIAPANLRAGVA